MDSPTLETVKDLATRFGYAEYMIERYLRLFGEQETLALLKANDQTLPNSIRVNTLKTEPKIVISNLQKRGFQFIPVKDVPYGFICTQEPHPLGASHEYLHGYFALQGVGSMIPVIALDPTANDEVVDMCAAPGSKSGQIAQLMENRGRLILLERSSKRIRGLRANLSRLGITNSLTANIDAATLPNLPLQPDKILLDAPCTGEGIIRMDPSRKNSRRIQDYQILSDIQKRLLKAGLQVLKPGGTLVYSTCSIAPEENEFVIETILTELGSSMRVEIEPIPLKMGVPGLSVAFGKNLNPDMTKCKRFYPHTDDTEGFFVAKLRKQ